MPKLFKKGGKKSKKEESESSEESYSSSDSDDVAPAYASVKGYELPKAPTRAGDAPQEDYSRPEYVKKAKDALPAGTSYVVLPQVSADVLQAEFDINEIAESLKDLKRKVRGLQELVDDAMFAMDDFATSKRVETEMEETLYETAVVHKRLTCLPPGLEVADFLPAERELYEQVTQDLFHQLTIISGVKNKYAQIQQKKLKKTLKIVHPDLNDREIDDKVEEAIMDGSQLLVDSSQVFAQEIIDDRYKREEAKIALMYAREQRKELEQIEKSIAQLHQMSVDLAALVQGQGEILNQMEVNIGNAVADSVKGLKMLEVAEAHKISSRKKKIIIGVIIAVVATVTILTIAGIVAGVICLCT